MDDDKRSRKLKEAQEKVEAVLAKEFPGESFAFWFFAAKTQGNNVQASFSSKANFDKSAGLSIWQLYATGAQNFYNAIANDFKPPEMVFSQPKPAADRSTS